MPTIGEVLELAKKFKAAKALTPEVYLMTTDVWNEIIHSGKFHELDINRAFYEMFGIPVEHYPTFYDVTIRAIELFDVKRFQIIMRAPGAEHAMQEGAEDSR